MYKKLEIELQSSTNTYLEDKVEVRCNFKMTDPSEIVKDSIRDPEDPTKGSKLTILRATEIILYQ